jgi:hypothetical protein
MRSRDAEKGMDGRGGSSKIGVVSSWALTMTEQQAERTINPELDVLKGGSAGNVVDENSSARASVVHGSLAKGGR